MIVARRREGISAAQIAIEENIAEGTVRHVYQKWEKKWNCRDEAKVWKVAYL